MTEAAIRDSLAMLYPGQDEALHQGLRAVLDAFAARHPAVPGRERQFSERDAVLICYGDHVQEPGVAPLESLRAFLARYARGLVSAVHILPFYPYSSDDGFSVIDYTAVDPALGTWEDVDRIAQEFDLMVDLVINHASASSEWFKGFLRGDPRYRDYFIAFEQPVDVSSVFRPRTHPLLTRFDTAVGERFVWTTFSPDQIDVNFANPEVLLEFVQILLRYIEHGARIIRLDAIAFLWKKLGTRSLHLPETHEVVKLLRRILEEIAPQVWIITETNVPHEENISYFGSGADEAHLVYNFALPPLLLYSFMRGDVSLLTQWATTLAPPSAHTAFLNFTASHDGIGVTALREMISPEEMSEVLSWVEGHGGHVSYRSVPGREPVPYEMNIVYLDALGGVPQFIASQAIALSLRGVPAIYFNSLIGARNWTRGVTELGYNRAINREKFDVGELTHDLEDPATEKHFVYEAYSRLLRARRDEPLFSPQAEQRVLEMDPRVFAVMRYQAASRLLCLSNVSGEHVAVGPDQLGVEEPQLLARDLLTGGAHSLDGGLNLAPYEVRWLKVEAPRLDVERLAG